MDTEEATSNENIVENIIPSVLETQGPSDNVEDDGEIKDNELEERPVEKKEEKNLRKRKQNTNMIHGELNNEPKSKKTALEKLKNMAFSKKDPFVNISAKESRRFTNSSRPISNNPMNKEVETKAETHKKIQEDTVYYAANQKKGKTPIMTKNYIQPGTLRQRIDGILSIPEDQIIHLGDDELYELIIQLIELEREQVHLLNGRSHQISELDMMLNKEKDEVDKLKKEIPEQFHPTTNIYENYDTKKGQYMPLNNANVPSYIHSSDISMRVNQALPTLGTNTTMQPSVSTNFNVPPPTIHSSHNFSNNINNASSNVTAIQTNNVMPIQSNISGNSMILPNLSQPPPNLSSKSMNPSYINNKEQKNEGNSILPTNLVPLMSFLQPPPSIEKTEFNKSEGENWNRREYNKVANLDSNNQNEAIIKTDDSNNSEKDLNSK